MRALNVIGLALAVAMPAAANAAQTFHLVYTTSVDATSGPAVTLDAHVTTDDGQFYGAPGYLVTGISGTRDGQAISFFDNLDELFYPGNSGGKHFDDFGLTYLVGTTSYQIYHSPSFFAYQEFGDGAVRIVTDLSVTPERAAPVPEAATWATMLLGLGIVGGALRRGRRAGASMATRRRSALLAG
jgi:hypothetical protein